MPEMTTNDWLQIIADLMTRVADELESISTVVNAPLSDRQEFTDLKGPVKRIESAQKDIAEAFEQIRRQK